jgi:hypothetical protein
MRFDNLRKEVNNLKVDQSKAEALRQNILNSE